jgi:hypothetical protein
MTDNTMAKGQQEKQRQKIQLLKENRVQQRLLWYKVSVVKWTQRNTCSRALTSPVLPPQPWSRYEHYSLLFLVDNLASRK